MWEQKLYYTTALSIPECIDSILRTPQQYECKWGTALYYRAEKIADNRIVVTFTGGQFRKMKRSQYYLDFSVKDNVVSIVLSFVSDLFGGPSLTPISDIDLFMKQKLNATRYNMTYNY